MTILPNPEFIDPWFSAAAETYYRNTNQSAPPGVDRIVEDLVCDIRYPMKDNVTLLH
jgi:hypothetical protein